MLKPQPFEDRAAGGERIDEEILRAALDRVAGTGGDEGAVEAAAAMGGDRPAAIQAAEPALRVRVQPADADRIIPSVGDVAADLRRARAEAVGELGFEAKLLAEHGGGDAA